MCATTTYRCLPSLHSRILADIGDEGWNTVQLTLVRISSILYREDLSFVGGSGGMDLDELWENSCIG